MKDKLTREYLNAVRIIDCQKCDEPALLLKNNLNQAVISTIKGCKIKQGGYILLDFGKELHGDINLTVHSTNGSLCGLVRVVFGESIAEALSEIGEKNATNNHSLREITVEVPFLSSNDIGKTGFRFVKLEVLSEEIEIKSITAVSIYRDIEYKGYFECDNEVLNKV